jgi:prevent-host-death family protein
MRYISASDAKQKLAEILDAAQRDPVMIRRQKRDVAVLLSAQEYERVCAMNREEFLRFSDRVSKKAKTQGLTENKLCKILADEGSITRKCKWGLILPCAWDISQWQA